MPHILSIGQQGPFFFSESFGLVVGALLPNPTRQEIRCWRNKEICYGVFDKESVPFFLLDIKGVYCSIHVLNIDSEQMHEQQPFDESDCLAVVLLCDSDSKEIKVMRRIFIDGKVLENFTEKILKAQEAFKDGIMSEMKRILSKYSNIQMIAQSQMYSSKYPVTEPPGGMHLYHL